MAQTKARAPARRSGSSQKSQTRSRGSAGRSRSSGKSGSASRARGKASGTQGKSPNGTSPADSARRAVSAVEHRAKDAGHAVGGAASKAKVPLIAGGAALVGAAGGVALGARQARHQKKGGFAAPRRPQLKLDSHDIARAAKGVGTFGAQMGSLASELQRNREAANGGDKHRSPLEVVLEGLTARRSRA